MYIYTKKDNLKKLIKIRLYPTKKQKREIFRQFNNHCLLYNNCLEERINYYKINKKIIPYSIQSKTQIPLYKNNCNYSSLQQTTRRLNKAFTSFFQRLKNHKKPGFPRFKKRFKSIEFTYGDGCKIKSNKHLYIQYIGNIKAVFHRKITNPKHTILYYSHGDFYVYFTIESNINPLPKTNKSIGIDFGLKTFITTSNNKKIQNPYFYKQGLKDLSKFQSKQNESTPKLKHIYTKKIQKTWKRIQNRRHDFYHKLANDFIKNYDTICIENLYIKKLQTNISNINKTYFDVCWKIFTQMLLYKAVNADKKLILINPKNTSKICSKCGKLHNLNLENRKLKCKCGLTIDRDYNAAKNILTLGLQCLDHS